MDLEFWHWWVLGFGLLVLELLLPTGFVLLWIGAAALIVGAVAWFMPALSWEVEAVLFGVLSVVSFLLWKRLHKPDLASDQPALNRRGHSYVGRSFTLEAPIVNGVGKLRVDDSQWRIAGPDTPAGSKVKVISVDGSTLGVELER